MSLSFKLKSNFFLATIFVSANFLALSNAFAAGTAHSISPAASWDRNPLKGFMPFTPYTGSYPISMEWFYIPLNGTQIGLDSFDWRALEEKLNAIASRGRQSVFRFYLDYPGSTSGVPQFLIDEGVKVTTYSGGGASYSPDYENEKLRTALKNFIRAFGAKYDGDKRIGFLQVGLLGKWGEWHTYPQSNLAPSDQVKNEVLYAFNNAFKKTRISARYPMVDIPKLPRIGLKDDSFAYSSLTGRNYYTLNQLKASVPSTEFRWRTAPFGGELRPEIQRSIFSTNKPWVGGNNEDWDSCVEALHPTYLMNNAIKTYSGSAYTNSIAAQRMMGYDFQVTTAYFDNITTTSPLDFAVDMKNIGVAPFYYDHTTWPIAVGIKNQSGELVKSWNTSWDLDSVPADATIKNFSTSIAEHGLHAGSYTIGIKVINPLSNGRNLGFANVGQNVDGWLNLGTINVSSTSTPETNPENKKPTARFLSPANSKLSVGSDMFVAVQANDSDGSISNVKLQVNGKFIRQEYVRPYEWANPGKSNDKGLRNLSAGTYTLRAIVTDNKGAETSISTTVSVQ